jgi:immunity protein, SdpI family
MDARKVAVIIAGIFAVMIGASVSGIMLLPSHALVATGFDMAGKPNGFARPLIAFSIGPAATIIVVAICLVRARGAVARSAVAFRVAVLVPLGVLAITHGLLIAYDLGLKVNVTRVLTLVNGLALIVTGNVFGKIRQNRWVGIKTPWSLRDE